MVLDLDLFRPDKGGDLEAIKENQKKRFKDVGMIDKVTDLDAKWRKCMIYSNNFLKPLSVSIQNDVYIQS